MNRTSSSLGLTLVGATVVANPLLSVVISSLLPLVLTGSISSYLAGRYFPNSDKRRIDLGKDFVYPSDKFPFIKQGDASLNLGYTKDFNKPFNISNEYLTRHLMIVGQSGVGKTVLINWLIWQQLNRDGNFIFIDAKLDYETLQTLQFYHWLLGISDKLQVINIANPDQSNTYNPIVHGDPTAKSARLINLIPSTSNNAGADYYTQAVSEALTAIFIALDNLNYAYTFQDLSILLTQPAHLERLMSQIEDEQVKIGYELFLSGNRKTKKQGDDWVEIVDSDTLKNKIGGMSGRISLFATGKMGKVFNTITPDVSLYDTITNNKNLYVMLPTMEQDYPSISMAKMLLSDLRSAVARVQLLPKRERPNPPFMVFADEMGSYAMESVSTLFEQARSAGMCMIPAFQAFSQLDSVSPEFSKTITQNCWTKVFFKFGEDENAEKASGIIGSHYAYTESVGITESSGTSSSENSPEKGSSSESGSSSLTFREELTHLVDPDVLKKLSLGECVVVSGKTVCHLIVPHIENKKWDKTFTPTENPIPLPNGVRPIDLGNIFLSNINSKAQSEKTNEEYNKLKEELFSSLDVDANSKTMNEVYSKLQKKDYKAIQRWSSYRETATWKVFKCFSSKEGTDVYQFASQSMNSILQDDAKNNVLKEITNH